MKKILLVNLDSRDDVLNLASIIENLKSKDAQTAIYTLTDEKYRSQVGLLSQVNGSYYIDSNEIQKVLKQRIFSDFEAVNSLWNGLEESGKQNWDLIINLSSSEAASFIVSTLRANEVIGNYKSPEKSTIGNNFWARLHYQGENHQTSGIHQVNSYNRIIGLNQNSESQAQIYSDSTLNALAHKNISRIRQSKMVNNEKSHVVGIQLENESRPTALSLDTICEMVAELSSTPNIVPVILTLKSEQNGDLIKKINQKFNRSVVIIETDFLALTSIMVNLDSIIASTKSFRILADLLETQSVFVTNDLQDVYENFSSLNDNITIYCNTVDYPLIRGKELTLALEALLTEKNEKLDLVSNQLTVYRSGQFPGQGANNELWNKAIAGGINQVEVLHNLVKRILVHNVNGETTRLKDTAELLQNISEASAYHWISREKNALSVMVKTTLAALRTIKTAQNNLAARKEFINSVDEIMANSNENHLVSLIAYSLKNKLDVMNENSSQGNLMQTENFLLELKSQVGLVANLISDVAEFYAEQKKEKTLSKNRSIAN